MVKSSILLSVLSDLHVAYVGNGATTAQVCEAMDRVKSIDPTGFIFGNTFEETMMLNSSRYDIFEASAA